MDFKQIIEMALSEYTEDLRKALDGLTPEERRYQPSPESHHIDFTVWHIARVEDHWGQRFARRTDTVWKKDGWDKKLGIPGDDNGYEYSASQVRDLPAFNLDEMMAYYESVRKETLLDLGRLTEDDLDFRPDPERRPEYTLGRMFSHLIVEESQHVGQVSYLRGIQRGLDK